MQKKARGRNIHQIVIMALAALMLGNNAALAVLATSPLSIDKHHFTVEMAITEEEQQTGLMFRKTLPSDRGMLFVFPGNQPVGMWMKDTLIPLDMLFIDAHGRIVHIAKNTTPESFDTISAGVPVKAVLELGGGVCDTLGIHVGDTVKHALFTP